MTGGKEGSKEGNKETRKKKRREEEKKEGRRKRVSLLIWNANITEHVIFYPKTLTLFKSILRI